MGFKLNAVNKQAQETGVWATYEGSEFLIAHLTSPAFTRKKKQLERPHERAIKAGKLSDETTTDILATCIAETILLDWKGVTDFEDEKEAEVPYDSELAKQALKEDAEFLNFVISVASDQANYLKESIKNTSKK